MKSRYIAFDIISISSYSELIELVELGYNSVPENIKTYKKYLYHRLWGI